MVFCAVVQRCTVPGVMGMQLLSDAIQHFNSSRDGGIYNVAPGGSEIAFHCACQFSVAVKNSSFVIAVIE